MFPYPIFSDNSEAQHSSISIYIPSAGRSFMLEFLCWSSKDIWFRCFPNCSGFSVICCSDFVFQERSSFFLIWGWISDFRDHGSWFRFAGCCSLVSWWIFSNNRWRPFRSWPFYLLNFFGSFDFFGRFCLLLCLCIILTWNPIDYLYEPLLLVVHQRFYCLGISSLWL